MKPCWTLTALTTLLLGAPVFAQAPPPDELRPQDEGELPPDEEPPSADLPPPQPTQSAKTTRRVRVTLRDGKVIEGDLLEHSGSYRIASQGKVLVLSKDQVKKVEFFRVRINVDVEGISLRDVMDQIARLTGHTIVVEDGAAKEKISISLREIPWREAVDLIARMTGCQVEGFGESLFVSYQIKVNVQFRNANLVTLLRLLSAYAGRSIVLGPKVRGGISCNLLEVEFSEALAALAYAASLDIESRPGGVMSVTPRATRPDPPTPRWLPFPQPKKKGAPQAVRITLDLRKVPLEDAAEKIGRLVQRNILVDPSTRGVVNLSLRNAPWPEALQLIARQTGCRMRTQSGIVLLEGHPVNVLSARKVPAASWFMALAEISGKNVIVAPEVNGLLEVSLQGVFLDDAFEQSARAYGYQVAEFGDIMVVTGKRSDPDAKPTGVKVAKHASLPRPKALSKAKPLSKEERAKLVKEVEQTFKEFEGAAARRDVESIADTFRRLRRLMARSEARGAEVSQVTLGRWKKRLVQFEELTTAIELQIAIEAGNSHLRAMKKAIENSDLSAALGHNAQLEQLLAEMTRHKRPVFARNAKALATLGRQLADHAFGKAGLIRVDAETTHRPVLRSILWSKGIGGEQTCCVILGRIYRAGDPYVLPNDEDFPGVMVKRIEKTSVTLAVAGKEITLKVFE
ncbi:MAG: hypothetical protein JKY65_23930 [Planctomycetes bacterium]|nr:hypothetical protein [Planctomycetota bacterium]